MKIRHLTSIFLASALSSALADDWLQFRGPNSSGVSAEKQVVTEFGDDSIAWSFELEGRGLSSPIIVGDKVFVTASSGPNQKRLHIYCLSDKDGSLLWERQFWASGRTMTHKKTMVAAGTPCSDGKHVYALYSSNDLIGVDLDGNLKWLRGLTYDYPNASNSLGMASSPVIAGGALVVQSENDSESFAAGIDLETGENLWKTARPKKANWTSPIVVPGKQEIVALQSSAGLLGVIPATGSEVWNYTDGASTIPSSAVGPDGTIYVPSHGITALKTSDKGGNPEQLWRDAQLGPGTGSPLVIGDKIYSVSKAGVLSEANTSNGERNWRIRTEGPYSGSPVAAGQSIYLFNEQGKGQIVDVSGDEGQVVSTIELGETILCTPAIANGAIYVRSDGHIWKLK